MKVSSIHTLQSSTSREKLLASVRSLRPFLCESLKRSGCDILQYTNGDCENDAYIQGQHYGEEQHSHIQSQNLGDFGREEHGMIYAQGQHQMHIFDQEHGHTEGNAQCHSHLKYRLDAHWGDGDEMPDSGHVHQYGILGLNPIVSVNSGTIYVHEEGHDHDEYGSNGYINAEYHGNSNDGNINDQLYGHNEYAHEHKYGSPSLPTSSPHMLVSSTDIPDMLNSSLEQSMLLHSDILSSTSLRFTSPDDWRLPTDGTLQLPPLHPHNLYSFSQHDVDYHIYDQHNIRGDQYHPQQGILDDEIAPALIDNVALDTDVRRLGMYRDNTALTAEAPILSSPCNEENVTTTTCAKAPSHRQKREPPPDTTKPLNSSDENDAVEDEGDHNRSNPNFKAIGSSSNINSERRRRKKINEALYALRSVVPIISKMDKASIVSDALTYAKQLQKQLDDMQMEIQAGKDGEATSIDEQVQEESSNSTSQTMDVEKYCQSLPKNKILELTVTSIEKNTYNLQMCCKKGPGDLLQLTRVVEALDLDILNTSVSSIGDHSIINTVVVKGDTDDMLKQEDLKEMVIEIGSKYGLHL